MLRIRELAAEFELEQAFMVMSEWPHLLWFDSAADRSFDRGRYSFLTADPVAWRTFPLGATDPWPLLSRWADQLTSLEESLSRDLSQAIGETADGLPPFWGGIAGLWTYEAAQWLEPSLAKPMPPPWLDRAAELPAVAVGIYDWVLAVDHRLARTLLISTGLTADWSLDDVAARRRESEVIAKLNQMKTADAAVRSQESAGRTRDTGKPDLATEVRSETCRHPTDHPLIYSNFADEDYRAAVAEIIHRIRQGDSFQVNLAQTLCSRATCSPERLYQLLRHHNPAPYACFLDLGDRGETSSCVLSSSPEGFLQVRDRQVTTRPIKGTVPRTGDDTADEALATKLVASIKDRAENIMIVDLMRNDLSRVCTDDSVEVFGVCELERYQRVQHLVSTVAGRLCDDRNTMDLLAACFPGGSITGAPKLEAMQTIALLEPNRRGPYCGSMGYLSLSGDADFNILIRTLTHHDDHWWCPVGGGITARSDPRKETQETWAKASGMLHAVESANG